MNNLLDAIIKSLENNKKFYISLVLFITIISALGLPKLQINNHNRVYFHESDPKVKIYDSLQDIYGQDEGYFVGIDFGNKSALSREGLSLIYEFTELGWTVPLVTRVDSITNFQQSKAEDDDIIVYSFVDNPEDISDERIDEIRFAINNDPLVKNRFVAIDEGAAFVHLDIHVKESERKLVIDSIAQLRAIIKKLEDKNPGIKFFIGGNTMVGHSFYESAQADGKTIVSAMYAIVIFLVYAIFRSFLPTILVVINIIFANLISLGIAGWLGVELNSSSINAPTITLTLAVADSIHLLAAIYYYLNNGLEKSIAVKKALKSNFGAIFFTTITSIIGFLSMNLTNIRPFHDLGNITSLGIAAAFVVVIWLIAPLCLLLPIKSTKNMKGELKSSKALSYISHISTSYPKTIIAASIFITVAFYAPISNLQVDDNVYEYFKKGNPFRDSSDFIKSELNTLVPIEFNIPAGKLESISHPDYIKYISDFHDYASKQPGVTLVESIDGIYKKLNMNLNADDPAFYKVPDTKTNAAQVMFLYEMSLPHGRDLSNQINNSKTASRVTVTTTAIDDQKAVELVDDLDTWLADNHPSGDIKPRGTGMSYIFSNIFLDNTVAMIKGTVTALILITLCMLIAMRSIKIGLISIIPNSLPIWFAFGTWYFLNGAVGLATSTVAMMAVGIIVDDSVHFLLKYRNYKVNELLPTKKAIEQTFQSTGRALVFTSTVLGAGFYALTFSSFNVNARMGMLFTIVIITALAFDFLLLPAILMIIDKKEYNK